jgi:hypothetical protein
MKKVTRIIGAVCMMGLLTFVSTSCNKEKENETTINVVVSGFEEDGERAYINSQFAFMWHESDYIRVYNLADEANADESATSVFSKIGNSTGETARFRGPSVGAKKAEGYRIFYPIDMVKGTAEEINLTLQNENRQVFQVRDHQQFEAYNTPTHHLSKVDGNAMPLAIDPENLTDNVTLKQIFGVGAFQFTVAPEYDGTIVVDSIKLVDSYHNITGDVSLKLHTVNPASLAQVSNKYFNNNSDYADFQDYAETELAPVLSDMGWMPSNKGKEITLNCTYEQNGQLKGQTVGVDPTITEFAFMLRPLALSEGFTLYVYIEGVDNPIVLTNADFYRSGHQTLDYTWAIKTKTYKRYLMRNTIDWYLTHPAN